PGRRRHLPRSDVGAPSGPTRFVTKHGREQPNMTEPMLEPVDEVEVLTVMDNSLDILMAGSPAAQRAKLKTDALSLPQPRTQHGVSMLVTVRSGGHEDS